MTRNGCKTDGILRVGQSMTCCLQGDSDNGGGGIGIRVGVNGEEPMEATRDGGDVS